MCGIALIISGIRIDVSSSSIVDFTPATSPECESFSLVNQANFSIDDLKVALSRRGPDSLGSKELLLHSSSSTTPAEDDEIVILSFIESEENSNRGKPNVRHCGLHDSGSEQNFFGELHFIGATLQLRGMNPITQPLVDSSRNILVYNGEIFGGIHVDSDSNDAEILMQSLENCCSCSSLGHIKECGSLERRRNSVPELLSTIKGPWALIYWQESSRTLWFGRDAFGRRSLLVHWPTSEDPRFLLSSVSPKSSLLVNPDFEVENVISNLNFWEELLCGVYSISINVSKADQSLFGEIKKHEWTSPGLKELVKWERDSVEPKPEDLCISPCKISGEIHYLQSNCLDKLRSESGPFQASKLMPVQRVRNALKESVMRRTTMNKIFQTGTCDVQRAVPVAVLFSGGLDSMILAALLDECLESSYEIDLLNVSFDGKSAPDRVSARAGVNELERISPLRRWRLVEIDAELSKLTSETKHVMSLINPAKTYMDLNIGIALWLAASGDGWVYDEISNSGNNDCQPVKYKSEARVLLVGSGADEQCAGYGRHRTKYRNGSWLGLHEEMKLDMQRIWKRNLGRDDRCMADNGKEARFPFLDEDVIKTLLEIPLWEVADLNQPSGLGDKKILREVAQLLGLYEAAVMPKRAIQFGSRIARESNRKNFGSNRAANQASAGSAMIYGQ